MFLNGGEYMTEIVSRKEFEQLKIDYRIYIIGSILFSGLIGFAAGLAV